MTEREQTFFYVLIVVLFASGAALLVLQAVNGYYKDTSTDDSGIILLKKTTKTATSTKEANLPSSTDWKTYKNDKYGFEIQYPSNILTVTQEGDIINIGAVSSLIVINPVSVGSESVFDINSGVNLKDAIFAGKKAKEYTCPQFNTCPDQISHSEAIKLIDLPSGWQKDNEIDYDIGKGPYYLGGSPESMATLADKILATLKFTK